MVMHYTSGVHHFSNNSMVWSQLFCLYYGCYTSTHRSGDIFQGIRPVFPLKLLLWVGLFLMHLNHRLRCKFQNIILDLVTEAWVIDNRKMQLITINNKYVMRARAGQREIERELALISCSHSVRQQRPSETLSSFSSRTVPLLPRFTCDKCHLLLSC